MALPLAETHASVAVRRDSDVDEQLMRRRPPAAQERALRAARVAAGDAGWACDNANRCARRRRCTLDRALVKRLATSEWAKQKQNMLITGPTGIGKTFLACAFAHKACCDGHTAIYRRVPRLIHELDMARADGSLTRLLTRFARADVLVLADWGLSPLGDQERRDILEIIEERHGLRSTIVSAQLPVKQWHKIIGEPTIADATLDRLVHNSHRFQLTGKSLRGSRSTTKEKPSRN